MSLPPHSTSMLATRLALTRSTHASVRLLATYPRLRFRAASRSSSETGLGYGSKRSTHTATAAKLYTPDVPLVVPTSTSGSKLTSSSSSSSSNNHLENPCLNHPTESTGLAHESDTGEGREFGMADAWGLSSGMNRKNKKQTQTDGDGEGGLSDEELNRMAMEKMGKAQQASGSTVVEAVSAAVSAAASVVSSASTAVSSKAADLTGSTSTSSSSSSTTNNEFVEIEQESIGRSTRPASSSASSSSSSSSSASTTAAAAPGTPARKAGRTIGLKGKKNAITLTPSAISRLAELADPETTTTMDPSSSSSTPQLLRISVRNRGCAGLAYHLSYLPTDAKSKFDEIVEQDGVKVLIDSRALFSVVGSEMDWVEDRMSARFVFKNPNVKDACGCGESFHV